MKSIIICEKGTQVTHLRNAFGTRYGPILCTSGHALVLKEPAEVREDWKSWSPELLWPGQFFPKKPNPQRLGYLNDIRQALKNVEQVILATDCDREGQLIGDEVLEYLRFDGSVLRALFNAEDAKSLATAFERLEPNEKWHNRYMAGQARQQADQITNLSLTRTATVSFMPPGAKGAVGIGRVKSPVLGIICKRELEIENFKPEDLFEIDALTSVEAGEFKLVCSRMPKTLLKQQREEESENSEEDDLEEGDEALAAAQSTRDKIIDRRIADALAGAAKGHAGPVSAKFEKKRQGPPKLFNLTGLQSTGSARFGWSAKHTLSIAQSLYDAPFHILTYPRSEAKYLPENDIPNVPQLLSSLLQIESLADHAGLLAEPRIRKGKTGFFSDKALEGFSHYAIVPNFNTADTFDQVLPKLNQDQRRMFEMVARQYMAAMAPDFEYRQTTVEMTIRWKDHDWVFRNTGRVPLVLGWKEILGGDKSREAEDLFPEIKNGEMGRITDTTIRTVTTRPPARYTEGSLIKVMEQAWRLVEDPKLRARLKEAKGIGEPSTKHDILPGLLKQGQVAHSGKTIKPTSGGMKLYQILFQACPNVVDVGRTAIWETIFDYVESGRMSAEDAVAKINDTTQQEIIKIREAAVKLDLGGKSKPTPKMVAFAKKIAERKKIKLPPGVITNSAKCKAFLDEHLGERPKNADGSPAPFPPSEAQRALAERLSEQTGLEIPEDALASSKVLSGWIDAAMKKAPPRPPSDKQLALAERLAEERDIELPEDIGNDMKACSAFIDKHMNDGKGKRGDGAGMAGRPPSDKQLALAERLASENGFDLPENAKSDMKACSAFIDAHMKGGKGKNGSGTGMAGRPPSDKQLALAERLASENGFDLPENAKSDMKACSAFIDAHMGGGKKKTGASRTR